MPQPPTLDMPPHALRTRAASGNTNPIGEPWLTLLRWWVLLSMLEMAGFTLAGALPRYNLVTSRADQYRDLLAAAGIPTWVYVLVHFGGAFPFLILFSVVAIVIFIRRNDDWMALMQSLALFATGMNSALFAEALLPLYPNLAPPVDFIRAVSENFSILPLVFIPTGRAEPRWMRYPAVAILLYGIIRPFFYGTPLHTQSWSPGLQSLWFLGTLGLGVFSMIYRYRKVSTPVHKQQQKWIILGIGIGVGGVIVLKAIPGFMPALVLNPAAPTVAAVRWGIIDYAVYMLTEMPIPLAIAFAILRYRLWEIDFLINRSLVYGSLTVLLAAVFAGSLLLVQALMRAIPGGGELQTVGVIVAAVIVAFIFQPARTRLRRLVDQRLYHIEVDYYRALHEEKAREQIVLKMPATRTHFGSYTDLRLIGRGGMGEVYQATDATLHRPVAIKVLPASLAADDYARRRFEREAQTIARLSHPNIVGIHDYGESDGLPYMVMEYVEGVSLGDYIGERGPLPPDEALSSLRDVASALDYAHGEGIIHRDIKPSNIMLQPITRQAHGPLYRAVLMDFGIAKILSGEGNPLTTTGVMGTIDYISPEQIQGAVEVTARTDIYSMGVMCFQMLTGQLPFQHGNPAAMLIAHLMEPAPDPASVRPGLPDHMSAAILRALAKRPEDRFAAAGEFVAALAA